jgi:hypothetical protein
MNLIRRLAHLKGDRMRPWRTLCVTAALTLSLALSAWGIQVLTVPSGGGKASVQTLGSDFATTSTTLAAIPGLSFELGFRQQADFAYVITYRSAATTTGLRLSLRGPATATLVEAVAPYIYLETVTEPVGQLAGYATVHWSSFDTANEAAEGLGSPVANTDLLFVVTGTVHAGDAGGTVSLQVASEVGGSAITVKAGSYLRVLYR